MNLKDIAVSVVGPGSQSEEDGGQPLQYMPMPSGMSTYVRPLTPEPEDVNGMTGAREAMLWLREALAGCGTGAESRLARLNALEAGCRDLVNQMLGEGEVSITTTRGELKARTQETVLAGVWRTFYLDAAGQVVADILEVADVPHVVKDPHHVNQPVVVSEADAAPEILNALPILAELRARLEDYTVDSAPHTINLTLLPLSDTELLFLDGRLGQGPVEALSRAYGKCQVISTASRNLWWVRYFNSMDTLILNTLEVVDVPHVVKAAPEDLLDSAQRLDEIIAPYWSDVA
jgi:hydrogenase-1 operon protein HyaF